MLFFRVCFVGIQGCQAKNMSPTTPHGRFPGEIQLYFPSRLKIPALSISCFLKRVEKVTKKQKISKRYLFDIFPEIKSMESNRYFILEIEPKTFSKEKAYDPRNVCGRRCWRHIIKRFCIQIAKSQIKC